MLSLPLLCVPATAGMKNPKHVTLVRLPGDVVRVEFPKKSFQYCGGQYVFLCIPQLGLFQW